MADPSLPAPRPRAVPLHPFLFAAYPILFLFAVNVGEVRLDELWLPLGLALAGAALTFIVARLVLGDAARAAALTSIGLVAFFGYGHIRALVGPFGVRGIVYQVAVAAAVGLAVLLVLRARSIPARLTNTLNVVAAVLILAAVVPVVGDVVQPDAGPPAAPATPVTGDGRTTDRDIYYIIPDRYGSRHVLETYYGVEQSELYDRLPELGFQVVPDSHSNYPRTLLSLGSSLNMRFLEPEAARHGPDERGLGPLNELLQEHEVGRFLKDRGYTYVHLGSWWDTSERNRIADVNPLVDGESDFLTILHDTTALPAITRRLRQVGLPVGSGPLTDDERHYAVAVRQFEELERIRTLPGPKFVFVHDLLPHPPYVFNADGSYASPESKEGRPRLEVIGEQIRYTDRKLVEFIERILDVPPEDEPIILLQADEGPNPKRLREGVSAYRFFEATPEELDEKFGILNAYHLPDFPGPPPHAGITPVNSFRLVLGGYFGADLPLLPDRKFVFHSWFRPYDMRDVTDKVPVP